MTKQQAQQFPIKATHKNFGEINLFGVRVKCPSNSNTMYYFELNGEYVWGYDYEITIHPTPSVPSQDSVAGVSADISVSDLRKVFAHRSSRIVEDLNQGANQLMTLTDFRLAVADMGWRIGFDQLADKDREILHLNDVIKSAQAEVERLKMELDAAQSNIQYWKDGRDFLHGMYVLLQDELAESKRRVAELEVAMMNFANELKSK